MIDRDDEQSADLFRRATAKALRPGLSTYVLRAGTPLHFRFLANAVGLFAQVDLQAGELL